MGKSGTGKSTSLYNLPPAETFIIKPNNKGLTFPGGEKHYSAKNMNLHQTSELDNLQSLIRNISEKALHIKYIVLED